eukprot:scaffold434_cov358-Prasinococcus_capsulatus_cf.AAC.16
MSFYSRPLAAALPRGHVARGPCRASSSAPASGLFRSAAAAAAALSRAREASHRRRRAAERGGAACRGGAASVGT